MRRKRKLYSVVSSPFPPDSFLHSLLPCLPYSPLIPSIPLPFPLPTPALQSLKLKIAQPTRQVLPKALPPPPIFLLLVSRQPNKPRLLIPPPLLISLLLSTSQPTTRTNRWFRDGCVIHFLTDERIERVRFAGLDFLLAGRSIGSGQGGGRDAWGLVQTIGSGRTTGFGSRGASEGGWIGAVGQIWQCWLWSGFGIGVAGRGIGFGSAPFRSPRCFDSAVRDWCGGGFGRGEEQLVELVFETAFERANALVDVYAQLDEFVGHGVVQGGFVRCIGGGPVAEFEDYQEDEVVQVGEE